MDELRQEYSELGTKLWHFAVGRVLLIAVFVAGFAGALETVETAAVAKLQRSAEQLAPRGAYHSLNLWSRSDAELREYAEELLPESARQLTNVLIELRDAQKKAFSIDVTLLGATTRLNILFWLYWAPILLLSSELYPHILRTKRRIVCATAAAVTTNRGALDELLFGGRPHHHTTFARQPYQLLHLAEIVFCLGCTLYLLREFDRVADLWQPMIILGILFTAAWYARAYAIWLEREMWRETSIEAPPVPLDFVVLGWLSSQITYWALKRRPVTAVGSMLVLSSLVLATGVENCSTPVSGLHLLANRVPAEGEWSGLATNSFVEKDSESEEKYEKDVEREPASTRDTSIHDEPGGKVASDDVLDASLDESTNVEEDADAGSESQRFGTSWDVNLEVRFELNVEVTPSSSATDIEKRVIWPPALFALGSKDWLFNLLHIWGWLLYAASLLTTLVMFVVYCIKVQGRAVERAARVASRLATVLTLLLMLDAGLALFTGAIFSGSWLGFVKLVTSGAALFFLFRWTISPAAQKPNVSRIQTALATLVPVAIWSFSATAVLVSWTGVIGYLFLHLGMLTLAAISSQTPQDDELNAPEARSKREPTSAMQSP